MVSLQLDWAKEDHPDIRNRLLRFVQVWFRLVSLSLLRLTCQARDANDFISRGLLRMKRIAFALSQKGCVLMNKGFGMGTHETEFSLQEARKQRVHEFFVLCKRLAFLPLPIAFKVLDARSSLLSLVFQTDTLHSSKPQFLLPLYQCHKVNAFSSPKRTASDYYQALLLPNPLLPLKGLEIYV